MPKMKAKKIGRNFGKHHPIPDTHNPPEEAKSQNEIICHENKTSREKAISEIVT